MGSGPILPFISTATIVAALSVLAAFSVLIAGLVLALSARSRGIEKTDPRTPSPSPLFWGIFPAAVTAAYFTMPVLLQTSFVFATVVAGYALVAGRKGKSFAPGSAAALALRLELQSALATVLLLGGAFAAGSFALRPEPTSHPYSEAVMPTAPRLPDCLPDDSIKGDFSGLWSTSFGSLWLSQVSSGSYTGTLEKSPVKGTQKGNVLFLDPGLGMRTIPEVALCRDGQRFDGPGPFGGYR